MNAFVRHIFTAIAGSVLVGVMTLVPGKCSTVSAEPINKHLIDKAPKEKPVPMPHLDPDNPDVIKLRKDPARDMWRQKRDYSKDPKRTSGHVSLQRYEAQMENVGVKTFFQQPYAWTQEDLKAGKVDVAIFGAPTGALPHSNASMWAPAEIRYTRDYGTYGATLPLGWVEYETLIDPFTILTVRPASNVAVSYWYCDEEKGHGS